MPKRGILLTVAAFITIGFSPDQALAHLVNTNVSVFYAGMLHPLTSAEHLLPMLALALLAGQCGKKAGRWTMLAFPLTVVLGILIGSRFTSFTFFHPAGLVALVMLGGLLPVADRITPPILAIAASTIGLILGYRSGVDMANAGAGLQFIPGAALTGFIVIALAAAWIPQARHGAARALRTLAGAFFTVTGLVMFGQYLFGGDLAVVRSIGLPTEESLTALVKAPKMTAPVILGAFLGAAAWGAAHALTPGHGKAIVGAYLVGAKSTPRHAVYLGLTVTATHTLGIFALGLVALFASKYLMPEDLYPWLGAVSGIIVAAIGMNLLVRRWKTWRSAGYHHKHIDHDHHHHQHDHHDHDHHEHYHDHDHHHDHSHLPPEMDGSPITWRSLLGLGISGGLLPCPSALVLLLAAVSLRRTGLGLALVFAFSLGLAGVLTTVGLLFVKGGRLLDRVPRATAMVRFLPILSSLAILLIGALITWRSTLNISF